MTPSIKSRALVATVFGLITAGSGLAFAQETVPPPPPASSPPPVGGSLGFFGERGQIVLSADDLQLALVRTSFSMGGGSQTDFLLQPALDYFVSPNLSVGGVLSLQTGSADAGMGVTGDVTSIGVAARVGYNLVLTNAVSLWGRAGFGYSHTSFDVAGTSSSSYQIPFFLFVPVLWHPTSHFFVGVGPSFRTELAASTEFMGMSADDPKMTQIGLQSTLGGYWGGP